jgi:hypothetical protein
MENMTVRKILASTLTFAAALALSAQAQAAEIKCRMDFTMSGWSAFYKAANGTGTVHCDNGQTMKVKLRARGGGLTVGKSTIDEGKGEFSGVNSINDLLGSYAAAEAHAGAVKSTQANVMTKGEVSLALSGKGRGWDLGIAFGKLSITK